MVLTDEDKKWLKETFATKADFEHFATKADLEHFATKADLEHFATKADLEHFATKADLERVETTLLTEFHKWASPLEARQRTHSAAIKAIDAEMEYLSDRVIKLEGDKAS
jgi:hypothetical protein